MSNLILVGQRVRACTRSAGPSQGWHLAFRARSLYQGHWSDTDWSCAGSIVSEIINPDFSYPFYLTSPLKAYPNILECITYLACPSNFVTAFWLQWGTYQNDDVKKVWRYFRHISIAHRQINRRTKMLCQYRAVIILTRDKRWHQTLVLQLLAVTRYRICHNLLILSHH